MRIWGRVRDSLTARPLSGASVHLLSGEEEVAQLLTDPEGVFECEPRDLLPEQRLICRVVQAGFRSAEVTCPLEEGEVRLEIDLEPTEIDLNLVVKSAGGHPREHIRITLFENEEPIGTDFSDRIGFAKIVLRPELEGQTLYYTAEKNGLGTVSGEIEIRRGVTVAVTVPRWNWIDRLGALRSHKLGSAIVILAAAGVVYGLYLLSAGPKEATIEAFEAVPDSIAQNKTSVLRWETSNATTVLLNGEPVAAAGSREVQPRRTTDYKLEAGNERSGVEQTVTLKVPVPAEVLTGLVFQFMRVYSELQSHPAGAELVSVGDPGQALVASSGQNGILSQGCRGEALDFAIETLRRQEGFETRQEAQAMAEAHLSKEAAHLKGAGYRDLFEHISECENFCRPWISQLVLCHIESVSTHDPGIVLFPTSSRSVVRDASRVLLVNVARKLEQDPASKVWLVGRASKLGPAGYNRKLSEDRALAVKKDLTGKGVSEDRIQVLSFGYEPPQITHQIATAYGFEEIFLAEGEQLMNQSVVVAVFEPSAELSEESDRQ